jgi:formylglycine-generating enzyme required for sulfatase activity
MKSAVRGPDRHKMKIIDVKKKLETAFTIIRIVLLIAAISFFHLRIGSAKESAKAEDAPEVTPTESEGNPTEVVKPQEITIPLPTLPKDAKQLKMVLIQPGTFTMGSSKDERGRSDHEWPPHEVRITKPFYMGMYEVTQAQWEAVMGSGSHRSKFRGRPDNPVEKVSWRACQKFIKRLNALGEGTFRLPTEAEWEFACRAGTNTRFSFGDALECADTEEEYCESADKHMWWSGNNDPDGTKEVGLKLPNPWGLYDMHGNVSEWCSDRWEAAYQRGPQTDPEGPCPTWFSRIWPLSNHVNRSGSIYRGFGTSGCRSASRHYEQAIDFHYSLGLRLVREYP